MGEHYNKSAVAAFFFCIDTGNEAALLLGMKPPFKLPPVLATPFIRANLRRKLVTISGQSAGEPIRWTLSIDREADSQIPRKNMPLRNRDSYFRTSQEGSDVA
jgi:hypothetical protein